MEDHGSSVAKADSGDAKSEPRAERHTPGPWASKNEALKCNAHPEMAWNMAVVEGDPGSNELVAMVWGYSPERVAARAMLIACAPDLLDALKLAAEAVREEAASLRDSCTNRATGVVDPAAVDEIERLERIASDSFAAISKATGERS